MLTINLWVEKGLFVLKIVPKHAIIDVLQRLTRITACSSATCAARSVCVSHLVLMGTRRNALATTTGKPKKGGPNAHEIYNFSI
ncbi:uncharacterized protein LOC122072706 isoform X2 [Macadamia integrifolia]|uniref:uncharacterized protein LOC122072706 isoform X2 n=1 Tax=Macadamia integrifolia TaxID=60698 RepID=UPI001C4F66BB|nr:uncharacterized protein LOC122072706 isoform X2 [Macadamia integrifolia]